MMEALNKPVDITFAFTVYLVTIIFGVIIISLVL